MYNRDRKKEQKTLLYRLLGHTVLFLVLFLSSMLLFYAIGNYQEFLDRDQVLILVTATVTSIILIFFSLSGVVLSLVLLIRRKTAARRKYIAAAVCMALASVYGFACMCMTRIIDLLSAGI